MRRSKHIIGAGVAIAVWGVTGMAPCQVALAEEPAADGLWQQLREGGRAIADDLRQRARPRWRPERSPVASEADTRWPDAAGDIDPAMAQQWTPPDVEPPRFSRIEVAEGGAVAIEGTGTPGSEVELRSSGRVVGTTVVDGKGRWHADLGRRLRAGTHRIDSSVRARGRKEIVAGADVRISIPEGWTGTLAVTDNGAMERSSEGSVRARAEAIARDASEQFSQIVPRRDSRDEEIAASAPSRERAEDSGNAIVRWLERSARGYQEAVVPELTQPAEPSADDVAGRDEGARESAAESRVGETALSVRERVNDWLDRARRGYQEDVASRLSVTTGTTAETDAATAHEGEPGADARPKAERERAAENARLRQIEEDQRRRENEERRQAELKRAQQEKANKEAEAARLAEIERKKREEAARQRREAEERAAELRRQQEEARRQAEINRRLDEAARLEAEARQKAEIAKRDAEAKRIAAEQTRKDKERKRLAAEAEAKRIEAERLAKIAEEKERRRREDPVLRAAEQKRLAEAAKKEEAKRLAEEAQRKEDERKRLAEEAETLAKEREAERERAAREVAIVRKEEEQSQQDAEAEQLAADHERRVAEAETAPRVRIPRKVRDPRPAEGSAEGDDTEPAAAVVRAADDAAVQQPRRVCRAKGRRVKGGRMHVVRPGETLWGLAQRYYGDGRRYEIIYRANKSRLFEPDLIVDCQRLFIPMRRRR